MEQAGVGQAALWPSGFVQQGLAPFGELIPGQGIDVRAFGQILQGVVMGRHDVRSLDPGDVIQVVFGPEQPGLQEGRGELPVGRQVIDHVDHVHHIVRQGREGAVQGADHIHAGLARLPAGQHQVDHRALFRSGEVIPAILQDGPEPFLFLDRRELGREEDYTSCRSPISGSGGLSGRLGRLHRLSGCGRFGRLHGWLGGFHHRLRRLFDRLSGRCRFSGQGRDGGFDQFCRLAQRLILRRPGLAGSQDHRQYQY